MEVRAGSLARRNLALMSLRKTFSAYLFEPALSTLVSAMVWPREPSNLPSLRVALMESFAPMVCCEGVAIAAADQTPRMIVWRKTLRKVIVRLVTLQSLTLQRGIRRKGTLR